MLVPRSLSFTLAAGVILLALGGPATAQSDAERLRALETLIGAQQAQIEA